jgi:hypothetical protein
MRSTFVKAVSLKRTVESSLSLSTADVRTFHVRHFGFAHRAIPTSRGFPQALHFLVSMTKTFYRILRNTQAFSSVV